MAARAATMRVGIDAAPEARDRPTIVIVLTDGLTAWPAEPSSCRLVAALIGDGAPEPRPGWRRYGVPA
ncbi:hypothetical protein ABS735_20025 [Streptomyces sp. MMCC 100]|uniref:hypothetical protein n=1 Tax=Streptomyces sp. MMCC 100 TaxID=3163555 RepID=UPI003598DA40